MDEKEIIAFYLENEILISPDLLTDIKEVYLPLHTAFSVLTKDTIRIIDNKLPISIADFEKSLVLKDKHQNNRMYQKFLEYIDQQITKKISIANGVYASPGKVPVIGEMDKLSSIKTETDNAPKKEEKISTAPVSSQEELSEKTVEELRKDILLKNRIRIVADYAERSRKRIVADFVNYFNSRYKDIEKILRSRTEMQSLTSIARINAKKERDNVAFIGFVYEKSLTKNNNLMLTLEDPTGFIKVVVRQNKEDLYRLAQEIQLDEVIGVTGTFDNLVFANNLLIPDVPLTKELKKSPEEGYLVVITDPQLGNKLFLEKEFRRFIAWINGQVGNDVQKEIASKIKYLFIIGDLVDGVGIYPDQEFDLNVIDITDQYNLFAEYMKLISKDIPIILCPGNHDVGRISEPQPRFHDKYSKAVWMMPNIIPVSNPSTINIFANPEKGFEGFDVLMYHGFSFVYYAEQIPTIRQKGGQKRPDLIMRYLLQRRHLAPTHTSNLYIPDPKKDHLTMDKVPDFFFSGHIHRASVNNYRNVTCINASCWVAKSDEQERRGLEPQPARAFIINMQTREIKIMNFLSKEDQEKETGDQILADARR